MNIEERVKNALEALQSLIKSVTSADVRKRFQQRISKREIVFSDHKNVNLKRLINNKKVVAAGVAAVMTFSMGTMSMVSYVGTTATNSFTVQIDKPVDTFDLTAPKKDQAVVTKSEPLDLESSQAVVPSSYSFKEMSKFVELPTLFNAYKECYVLRVNGRVLGYFKNEEEPQAILDNIIASQVQEDAELLAVGFAENVGLELEEVSIYDFDTYADQLAIEELIRIGTNEKRVYKVVAGDTLSQIAERHGMGESQLIAANPAAASQKYLQIDQELSLVVPVPLINVQTTQRVTRYVSVAYSKVEEGNSNLYQGESSVKVRGVNGKVEVVEDVVKINGQEIKEKTTEVSRTVISEPKTQVLYVGTKPPPPRIGTGTFARPLSRGYHVSSPFGARWGSMHTGIDLALPSGSPVLAADGGRVIFSGNQGTYGLLVIIDHGGNLSSYYAHNSKLLVKKGDEVFKGQKIALSGNTGRSTGPHLHFEIRKNNVPVNPTKYLKF